jgi:dihydrofolate reductase
MRKIIEATLVTLNGVFEAPNVWATKYFDEEAGASALARLMAADGMLMGRGVYEFFLAAFPHQTGDYAARINSMRKYVVSNTLDEARWNNSTVIRGDLVAQISNLKEEGERDLVMYGHGRLRSATMAEFA